MQDRYAGDIGDFGKYALLRALGAGRQVGLCWYLTSGAGETSNDGRHTDYLDRRERFRDLDPVLFDRLHGYREDVQAGRKARSVAELEKLTLLPASTAYHRALVPPRGEDREGWMEAMVASVRGADLLLLDPDNGLEGKQLSHKCVSFEELQALRAPGRTLLLYQHQTRMKGGAAAEVRVLSRRLEGHGFGGVEAIRFRPYSSRYYLVLDGTRPLIERLDAFAERWGEACVRFRRPKPAP